MPDAPGSPAQLRPQPPAGLGRRLRVRPPGAGGLRLGRGAPAGRAPPEALGVPFEPALDRVLARADVQAVTICATNDAHADLAVAAAGAGKHVMMQKPMATTLADCDRIVEAVERAGVLYYQSHNLRFDPVHQAIGRRVDAGALGRLALARRRHSHAFALLNPTILEWMRDPLPAAGGAFMDEGAHVALWFLWMFGAPALGDGDGRHLPCPPRRPASKTTASCSTATGRNGDGLIGVHQSSWTELAATTTVELFGDGGVLVAGGTDISSSRSAPLGRAPPAHLAPQPPPAGDRPAPAHRSHRPWETPGGPPRQPPQRHRRGLRRSAASNRGPRAPPPRTPAWPAPPWNGPGRIPILSRGARGLPPRCPVDPRGTWRAPPPLRRALLPGRSKGGRGQPPERALSQRPPSSSQYPKGRARRRCPPHHSRRPRTLSASSATAVFPRNGPWPPSGAPAVPLDSIPS